MYQRKVSVGTITRTVLLALALLNQLLVVAGHSIIPISDEEVTEFISVSATIVTSVISWWKNNSFTDNALIADNHLKQLKVMDTSRKNKGLE